jgi:two-component sensor histidine kinase
MILKKIAHYSRLPALYLCCAFLLTCCKVYAQVPDFNRATIRVKAIDTPEVRKLLKISDSYNNLSPVKDVNLKGALYYESLAEQLSLKLDDDAGLGHTYMSAARTWCLKKDSAKCNSYVRRAIAVYMKKRLVRDAAECWLKMEEYHNYFPNADLNKRIYYYERALALFYQAHATDRAAATLKILGDFYMVQGNFLISLIKLKQSLLLYQSIGKKDVQGIYDLIGNVNAAMGNYKESLKYGLLAVQTAEAYHAGSQELCTTYNRLGITYYILRDFNHALHYYEKSLHMAELNKDTTTAIMLTNNIVNTYLGLKNFVQAFAQIKEAARKYHPTDLQRRIIISGIYLRMLIKMQRDIDAQKYCDTLLQLGKQLKNQDEQQIYVQENAARFFLYIKNYAQARKYAAQISRFSNGGTDMGVLYRAYELQYQIDSAATNYAGALKSLQKFTTLKDSLFNISKSRQLAQLEIQYQTEKKDQELKAKESNIEILRKQTQLQKINLKQQETTQNLIIAGTILLALLLGLSYNRYRLKQRINRQLQQQQTEINLKNRSLVTLVGEKDNLLEEKEWLMKEIHHRVKNNLQIVISLLNTQSTYLKNDIAYNAIRESQHRMQSISLIHQKLYQSENLALVNLRPYVDDLIHYLTDSFDIADRIKFETDIADIELDVTKSVPLGLILNEAITNAIKYAFAPNANGNIAITLKQLTGGLYELRIGDNGVGLAEGKDVAKSKTLGMSLMRGLSKQLSGTLAIENNNGVTIIITFTDDKFLKAV